MSNKTFQVADNLHGSIRYTEFEKQIISTQAFNRLHHILQNSTVYLTYPSNHTKRFAHSLGVMHLAGEMFKTSIKNANSETQELFYESINLEISKLLNDNQFNRILRERLQDQISEETLERYKEIRPVDSFFISEIPTSIKSDHIFAHSVILQSIRCAALLHDIGHPPFSHVTEYALKEVMDIVNNKESKTVRENTFLDIMKRYQSNKGKVDLHEKIGNRIADRLLDNILRTSKEYDTEQYLFYSIICYFTNYILEDKKDGDNSPTVFAQIHRIVDGSIDCDRLDYVSRDINSSMANKGKIEYDRLVNSMKLLKNNDSSFVFCFDLRALSSIEDFFLKRWHLYKYTIFHHRVIKTDSLLGKIIVSLALDYLSCNVPDSIQINKSTLPLDISGLWRAVKELFQDDSYFNALIQWDDSWLLTVLRQNYYSNYRNTNKPVKYLLEELLSNKKNFTSLVKRMDDFLQIDNSIIANLKDFLPELEKLEKTVLNINHKSSIFIQRIIKQIDSNNRAHQFVPTEGFLLNNFVLLTDSIGISNFDDVIKEAIYQELESNSITKENSIIAFKKLKTGLEKSPHVHYNDKVITFDHVSNIEEELNKNKSLFPVFFIYIQESQGINFVDLRIKIGEHIAHALKSIINDLDNLLSEGENNDNHIKENQPVHN